MANNNNKSTLEKLLKQSTTELYGNDGSLDVETDKDLTLIQNSIANFRQDLNKNVGNDPMDFYNSIFDNEYKSTKHKGEKTVLNSDVAERFLDNEANPLFADGIMMLEQNRVNLYNQYKLIYDHIPQVAMALDTYVDNILSPDDFTKTSFNIFYNNLDVNENKIDDKCNETVIEELKKLNKTYNIEGKCETIIRDTLICGDQFVLVLDIEKEISKLIEGNDIGFEANFIDESQFNMKTNEAHVNITEEEAKVFIESEVFNLHSINKKDSNLNEEAINELNTIINNCINKNIIFSDNPKSLLSENYELENEYFLESKNSLFNNFEFDDKKYHKNINGEELTRGRGTRSNKLGINGCVTKILKPERVIKLEMDDICYGYYVIEGLDYSNITSDGNPSNLQSSTINSAYNSDNTSGIGMGMSMVNMDKFPNLTSSTSKRALITNLFIRGISDKLDKKFIKKNKQFKDLIYGLLRENYIIERQIKVTYIPPENMVHFTINKKEVYGDSIFRKILFPAKLYLAVLISSLLSKLTRAQDRRVYYVEVGLENDEEEVVQSFARDIKNREFKMNDYNDINVILNQSGMTADYFIPVINGEKPIEIDTLQGMDVQQDNELLEFLLKSMISGMGVPSSFLNYTEDVEFVRTLTMQNGMFLRSIIKLQKNFSDSFSEYFRKLYKIHYKDNFNKRNKQSRQIDLNDILVRFPVPSSSTITTLSDQINSSQSIVDFIMQTISKETDGEDYKFELRKKIIKDYVPSVEWEKYDKYCEEVESLIKLNKLKNASIKGNTGEDEGQGDMDFSGTQF